LSPLSLACLLHIAAEDMPSPLPLPVEPDFGERKLSPLPLGSIAPLPVEPDFGEPGFIAKGMQEENTPPPIQQQPHQPRQHGGAEPITQNPSPDPEPVLSEGRAPLQLSHPPHHRYHPYRRYPATRARTMIAVSSGKQSPFAAYNAGAANVSQMAIVDSGCTICLLVNEGDDLIQDPVPTKATVTVADGGRVQAISTGLVEATLRDAGGNELDIDFKDALSVNGIGAPLISVSSLAEQGALIAFNQDGGTITVGEHCKLSFGSDHKLMCIVRKPQQNAAKTMDLSATSAPGVNTSAPSTLPTSGSSDLSAKLYRARFNHVGIRLVAHTLEQTAAAKIKPQTFIESDVAKMKAIPFNGTRAKTTRAFERIHSDVLGPINGLPPTVPKWAIAFKDDFTSYVSI
jgi:hypothetical protein